MKLSRLFLTVLLYLGLSGCASTVGRVGGVPSADVAGLDRAIVNRDTTALDRLLADDLIWIRGSGEVGGKADFVAALTRSELSIRPFQPLKSRLFASARFELWTGLNELRGEDEGEPFVDRHHFADLWEKRDGHWKLVFVQITRSAEAPLRK